MHTDQGPLMRVARSARGKLRQLELWLRATYPLPAPVRVQVRSLAPEDGMPVDGTFRRTGRRFSIAVAPAPYYRMADALLHEWAHLLSWSPTGEAAGELAHEHPDEWGLWDARLRRGFYDEGGCLDALEFSPRPWR